MKLILLCHGATATMREGGFPAAADVLDDGARRKLIGARAEVKTVVASPSRAALETAEALGARASIQPELRDMDHGAWSGRSFAEIAAGEPAAFADWLARPWNGTPAGEPFGSACERAGDWLDRLEPTPTEVLAIVSPMIVRAVLSAAIQMPASAAMRVDVVPLTTTTLFRHRGWRLQQLGAEIGQWAKIASTSSSPVSTSSMPAP